MASFPEPYHSGSDRLTFPRTHHLKRKSLIEPLFDRSNRSTQSVASGTIRIVYRFVDEPDISVPFQFGIAVGKKSGSAVRRNRIRRVIRESVRLNQALIPLGESLLTAMIIFRGHFERLDKTPNDVVACLEKLAANLVPEASKTELDPPDSVPPDRSDDEFDTPTR